MGQPSSQTIELQTGSAMTIAYKIEKASLNYQCRLFKKRRSFNAHIHPINSYQKSEDRLCSDKFATITIKLPSTQPFTSKLIDCLTLQQKKYVLLVMLYGYGELYRHFNRGFRVSPQMVRFTNEGQVYVWFHSRLQKNEPQIPNNEGQIKLVANIMNTLGFTDWHGDKIGGFVESIIALKTNVEQMEEKTSLPFRKTINVRRLWSDYSQIASKPASLIPENSDQLSTIRKRECQQQKHVSATRLYSGESSVQVREYEFLLDSMFLKQNESTKILSTYNNRY